MEVFKIKISFVILDTARVERRNDMLHVTKASRRENLTINIILLFTSRSFQFISIGMIYLFWFRFHLKSR